MIRNYRKRGKQRAKLIRVFKRLVEQTAHIIMSEHSPHLNGNGVFRSRRNIENCCRLWLADVLNTSTIAYTEQALSTTKCEKAIKHCLRTKPRALAEWVISYLKIGQEFCDEMA